MELEIHSDVGFRKVVVNVRYYLESRRWAVSTAFVHWHMIDSLEHQVYNAVGYGHTMEAAVEKYTNELISILNQEK